MRPGSRALTWADLGCLVFLVGLTAVQLARGFDFALPPYEDAAILMRYAEHLAGGHGIVWNVGEAPIDGATDFLFLVALAGLSKVAPSIEAATQWLGIATHLSTVLLVFVAVRRLHGAPRWAALLSATVVAVGPGLRYVEAYFGTPFFALFATLTWIWAQALFLWGPSAVRSLGFACSGLLLGLTRPDGVLLATFILLGLVLFDGWRRHLRVVRDFGLVFGLLGGAYFAWRWSYFGHPLPNPFYVKGDFNLYPAQLVAAVKNALALTGPLAPIVIAAGLHGVLVLVARGSLRARLGSALGFFALAAVFLVFRHSTEGRVGVVKAAALLFAGFGGFVLVARSPLVALFPALARDPDPERLAGARQAAFFGLVLLLFTVMWILLSGGMDYMMRYHYPVLPIVAITWPPLLFGLLEACGVTAAVGDREGPRLARAGVVATFFAVAVGYQVQTFPSVRHDRWGTLDVARILADYDHGYTIALTNAGQLPFYSKWRCLDAWGLSDPWIPRHGLDAAYVDRWKPDVIQFDANYSPLIPAEVIARPDYLRATWYHATYVLKSYAEEHGYVLAAAFGITPYKAHYYYVRADLPERAELVERIRAVDYRIDGLPTVAVDYARIARTGRVD